MDLLRIHPGSFVVSIVAQIAAMLLAYNFCITALSIAVLKPVTLLCIDFGSLEWSCSSCRLYYCYSFE